MIRWFEKNWKVSIFILILGFVGIFYVSSLEFYGSSQGEGWTPFVYHFSAFFLLGMFLLISLVRGERRENLAFGVVIGVVYGISDELHQMLVPGRYFSLADILLDSVGVFCAFLVYGIVLEKRKLY